MNILCYHIQNDTIFNSDGEYCKEDYIEWLLRSKRDTIRVFYHLDYFVARLLKLIGITKEQAVELSEKEELILYGRYKIKYFSGKFFSIDKGSVINGTFKSQYWQNWSDISQYFDDCEFSDSDDGQVLADNGKEKGEQVYEALISLDLNPTSLISPLNIFEKERLKNLNLIREEEYPSPVGKYAYGCKRGGHVEAYKIGHFNETWDYDMKSAYAYFTSKLINTRFGKWVRSGHYEQNAYYGYGIAHVDIEDDISPLIFNNGDLSYTPCGVGNVTINKKMLEFINDENIGEAEVKDFVWFYPDKIEYPFEKIINELYEKKEKAIGLNREIIKRCSSTIWGLLLQFNGKKLGELFNSPLGVDVECSEQLEVMRFAREGIKKGCDLLHIAVDGVLLAGSHTSTTSLSNDGAMGSWALTAHSPAFVVGSGCVAIKETQKDNPFSLRYDWLMSEIRKNPDSRVYTMEKIMPMTLGKALVKDKDGNDDFDKLGELIKSERRLEVDFEMKREYGDLPTCGRDLLENKYDSIPRDMVQASIL